MLFPRRRIEASIRTLMPPTDTPPSASSTPNRVLTEAGPITVTELPALKVKLADLQAKGAAKAAEAQSLRSLAADRYASLGASVLGGSSLSVTDSGLAELLNRARSLRIRI